MPQCHGRVHIEEYVQTFAASDPSVVKYGTLILDKNHTLLSGSVVMWLSSDCSVKGQAPCIPQFGNILVIFPQILLNIAWCQAWNPVVQCFVRIIAFFLQQISDFGESDPYKFTWIENRFQMFSSPFFSVITVQILGLFVLEYLVFQYSVLYVFQIYCSVSPLYYLMCDTVSYELPYLSKLLWSSQAELR